MAFSESLNFNTSYDYTTGSESYKMPKKIAHYHWLYLEYFINKNHAAYLGVLTHIKDPLGQPLSQLLVTRLSHGGASNLVME